MLMEYTYRSEQSTCNHGDDVSSLYDWMCVCVWLHGGYYACVTGLHWGHNDKTMHWSAYIQVPPWRSRQRVSLIIWRSWVRASQVALLFFFIKIFFDLLHLSCMWICVAVTLTEKIFNLRIHTLSIFQGEQELHSLLGCSHWEVDKTIQHAYF